MPRRLTIAALALLCIGAKDKDPNRCGIYPDSVHDKVISGGFADCRLKAIGEKPIWKGLDDARVVQHIRFVFHHGHGSFTRIINLIERDDGKSYVETRGIDSNYRQPRQVLPRRREQLTSENWAILKRLGAETGAWQFDVGTWDGDEIYMHCQTLDMERRTRTEYRYSSVNIGCNHPTKLMPLVDQVVKLGKLQTLEGGRLYK